MSFDAFARDADLRDLVAYRLLCVSEAAKNVLSFDPRIGERYPDIPWRNVRDIGNFLCHQNRNVAAEVVWETVMSGDLRALATVAQAELAKLDD